eukprot:gb/GECG01010231.1/.p1 GENE.gb/GECG01010231.1/~~gb/GECG01010231.1/.p1  ORF type:complete len:279 (+),score=21.99 gb/GECG01010231.1/:1-837(+)
MSGKCSTAAAACSILSFMCLFVLGWTLYSLTYNFLPPTIVLPTEASMRSTVNRGARNRVLLHIAKTAGMTIRGAARRWIEYEVHTGHRYNYGTGLPLITIDEFHPKPTDTIYISIRDPLKRTVSAWKFRHRNVVQGIGPPSLHYCSLCEEKQCFALYGSINEVAEALFDDPNASRVFTEGCIDLVRQNYTHFIQPISDYIEKFPKNVRLIRTENLEDDMKDVFGIKPFRTTHKGPQGGGDSPISSKAEYKLRRFLEEEYKLYNWLLDLKGLRNGTYDW